MENRDSVKQQHGRKMDDERREGLECTRVEGENQREKLIEAIDSIIMEHIEAFKELAK